MAHSEKKYQAIEMRRKGMSYSQIKKELQVSKSTLSLWLRHMPLPIERIRQLRDFSEQRIERFRNTMRLKREVRLVNVYEFEKKRLLPLSNKELYIAGLLLYWGEGGKTARTQITISNTDPAVARFFMYWAMSCLGVTKEFFKVKLHLYADMNIEEETRYWSLMLGVTRGQFTKPYVKRTTLRGLTYKTRGHGTCNVIVYGRDYYEKVMMGIRVLSNIVGGDLGKGDKIPDRPVAQW